MLLVLIPLTGQALSFEGKSYSKKAEYIDLGDTVVKDFDAFIRFLDKMPNLKQVDMWKNKMTKEQCDRLAKRYPNMRWGWTMVIKNWDHEHLVRTDYTSWSTLHNNRSAKHGSEDFSVLKYCWDLKALDIGHNKVESLDFLYDLPDLRVLIIACNAVTDITPIGSLKKLEYAELFNNKITDITPLKKCKHLLDLNLGFNKIKDLSPVKKLKHLQRLWLFSSQQMKVSPPKATVDDIQKALPDTQIDTTHHPTTGTWRYIRGNRKHPHYACIVQMFGEDHLHPRYEYVPFDDSWTDSGKGGPVVTPSPLGDAPALKLKKAQNFSDRKYRLPIDFSAGKKPKKSGYTDKNTYTDWSGFYEVINRCNTVIKYAPGVAEVDPAYTQSELQANIAEMVALRSLSYFYLIRTFRDVPFSREAYTDDDQKMDLPATKFDAVVDSLIDDLESVKNNAVKRYPVTKPLYQTGRVTQDFIHALLCELYLWKKDYQNCIRYADMVIAAKKVIYEENRLQKTSSTISQTNDVEEKYNGYPLVSNSSQVNYFGDAYDTLFGYDNDNQDELNQEIIFQLIFDDDPQGSSMRQNGAVNTFYGNSQSNIGFVAPSDFIFDDYVNSEIFIR